MGTSWRAEIGAMLADRKSVILWIGAFSLGLLGGILGSVLIGGGGSHPKTESQLRAEMIEKNRVYDEERARKMEGRRYWVYEKGDPDTRHERSDCPDLLAKIEDRTLIEAHSKIIFPNEKTTASPALLARRRLQGDNKLKEFLPPEPGPTPEELIPDMNDEQHSHLVPLTSDSLDDLPSWEEIQKAVSRLLIEKEKAPQSLKAYYKTHPKPPIPKPDQVCMILTCKGGRHIDSKGFYYSTKKACSRCCEYTWP